MKKFISEATLTAEVMTTIAGSIGMIYTTNRHVEMKQESINLQREIKLIEDKREWERFEIIKYDRRLPSKFYNLEKPIQQIDTPVSDHLNNTIKDSRLLN
ncbi:MAG: hypothetical protein ACTHVR_12550 [Staphylococcus equorum]